VVDEFAGRVGDDALRAQGIEVFRGEPSFEAYDTVLLDGKTRINAQRFAIATGSRAVVPKIPGLAEVGHLDSGSVWTLNERPQTLIVVGAEPTGLELAQAFARLGSRVTVLVDSDQLLPWEEPEVAGALQARLAAEGIEIRTGGEISRVAKRDGQVVCSWRSHGGGTGGDVVGTHLLVAAGRLANVEGLNLEAVGIHTDAAHGIEVDEYLQTRSARVYALGDVLQQPRLAQATERQVEVVFQNAVLRLSRKFDDAALPRVVFVDPEVATVGLTEAAAGERHPELLVFHARFEDLARARIEGRTEGFAKVVATPSGKILGAAIVGEQASLILQELVVAMEHGLSLGALAATPQASPTYAGVVRQVASQFAATRREGSLVRSAWKWVLGFNQPRTGSAPAPGDEDHSDPVVAGHANGHGH